MKRRQPQLSCWRLATLSLLVALGLAVMPGRIVTRAAAAQPVTIQIWDTNANPDLVKYVDSIFKPFEKSHPGIQLKLVHGQSLDKDLTAIAGGSGPDLVWLWDGNQPMGSWAANGVIQPIDKFMATTHYNMGKLVPAGIQTLTWHGHIWGLPLIADTFWLFYNMRDFKEAGLDPKKPPRTLEELMVDAQKLTKRTASGRILRLGYDLPGYSSPAFLNGQDVSVYNPVFGASLFNSAGTQVTPNSPAVLAVWHELRKEYDVYNKLYGHDAIVRWGAGLGQAGGPQDGFVQDRFSMRIEGDWETQEVRDYRPTWKYGVDYAAAPIPYPKGYEKYANHQSLVTYPIVMSSRTKHPAEAWAFMRWAEEPEQTVKLTAVLNDLPQSEVALHDQRLIKQPGFGQLIQMLQRVKLAGEPSSPVSEQYYSAIRGVTDSILNGQTTPESAMQKVRGRIQPQLSAILAGRH